MKIYKQKYQFSFLDPKTCRPSCCTKTYEGWGFTNNGPLKSAIRQFNRYNKVLWIADKITEIKLVKE